MPFADSVGPITNNWGTDLVVTGDGSTGAAALNVNASISGLHGIFVNIDTSTNATGTFMQLDDPFSSVHVQWNTDASQAMTNLTGITVTYDVAKVLSGGVKGLAPLVGSSTSAPAVGEMKLVDVLNQGAAIAAANLTNATPAGPGYYIVHYTLEDTTADLTAGSIQFQINYTDDIGATTQAGAALVLTATGRDRGSFQVYLASGNITYQTNLVGLIGTAKYALHVRCVFIG